MAQKLYEETNIQNIANAIRTKLSTTDTYKVSEMSDAILSITGGSDPVIESLDITVNGTYTVPEGVDGYSPIVVHVPQSDTPPDEAFLCTGDCTYRFAYNGWNWFIDKYKDRIITKDISSANYMFTQSNNLTEIPFDLNLLIKSSTSFQAILVNTFQYVNNVEKFPNIYLTAATTDPTKHKVLIDTMTTTNASAKFRFDEPFIFTDGVVNIVGIDYECFKSNKQIEEMPAWLYDMVDWEAARTTSNFGSAFPLSLTDCCSLKTYSCLKNFYNDLGSYYMPWYGMSFSNCYCLQEVVMPRPGAGVRTSGSNPSFGCTYSMKRIVFDVQDDGTPYTAKWKNTTLNLENAGSYYGTATGVALTYLNADKKVSDDATYQALKNDPEYWASIADYAPYNHNAVVETINSLPDTSAYGTNTIKFKGANGALTDGGAINTLTEEEIAVATAKGWTVTLT